MRGVLIVVAVMLLVASGQAADASSWKASTTNAEPPAELNDAVQKELDPAAVAVVDGADAVLTIWFRKTIPVKATAEQIANGLTYREIPDGSLLAAVKFHRAFTDYRKQEIPAGVYTLRFAVQPETGDHMGTTPHPEFALLSQADIDTTPDMVEVKAVVKRSIAATGGDHPGVVLLFPHYGKEAGPTMLAKADGAVAVVVRRPVDASGKATTLGFAVTVAGHSKTR